MAGTTSTKLSGEIGAAYATWSGAGTALIAIIGIVLFQEPGGLLK